jgi:hypothetical protein
MRTFSISPGKSSGFWSLPIAIFGELIFNLGLSHAGVLFFRLPGASLETKIEHLDQALQEHANALPAGEFVVVAPGNIRAAGRPRS